MKNGRYRICLTSKNDNTDSFLRLITNKNDDTDEKIVRAFVVFGKKKTTIPTVSYVFQPRISQLGAAEVFAMSLLMYHNQSHKNPKMTLEIIAKV